MDSRNTQQKEDNKKNNETWKEWGSEEDNSRKSYNSSRQLSPRKSIDEVSREGSEGHGRLDLNENCSKINNENKPCLDFLIFISNEIKETLVQKKVMDQIIKKIGDISMDFDPDFKIPEYYGCLLKIKGPHLTEKRDATQELLEFIVNNNLDQQIEPNKNKKRAIIIMIPNGLVSMIIGTKGKQISNLIKESGASIVINQPIYKMCYRTVTISGYPKNIADGIMYIQKIMEERYNEVQKIEFESPPLNVTTTQTNVKLVFTENIADRISSRGKKESIIDELEKEFDVHTTIYKDSKNRQLDRKDYIVSLKGTIEHVQAAIISLSKSIKRYIKYNYDGKDSYQLRILINKVFVTKLIGAGGCMIQEIANFAKGASIKILSNKNDEMKNRFTDIPLCVAGNFYSVQDATCIIIEQMECFKNGGPVLKSGKSLHENIANQFMNSIFTNAQHGENEDEHIYTLKERFAQNNQRTFGESAEEEREKRSEGSQKGDKRERLNSGTDQEDPKVSLQRDRDRQSDYQNSRLRQEASSAERERERDSYRKNSADSYERRNRSRSRSRSRSRGERNAGWGKSYERKEEGNNRNNFKSKDFYESRNYKDYSKDYHHDYHHKRSDIRENKHSSSSYQGQFSYLDNGVVKMNTSFTVPDHLVSLLIGKNGENVRKIMNKTEAVVTFGKEVSYFYYIICLTLL